jgi:hypothetical protein
VIKQAGVYEFTGRFALLAAAPTEVIMVLIANNGTINASPVLDGGFSALQPAALFGGAYLGNTQIACIVHLAAGAQVRVGYLVSADAQMPPGAYLAAVQISADS